VDTFSIVCLQGSSEFTGVQDASSGQHCLPVVDASGGQRESCEVSGRSLDTSPHASITVFMGKFLDTLTRPSSTYAVERTGDGFVLVAESDHRLEFSDLVRDLLNEPSDEFVILPVSDGGFGYERAVILPY
jgi:hypothetical protein